MAKKRTAEEQRAAEISASKDLSFVEGGKQAFLDAALNAPVAQSKMKKLGTRAFSELKGVTAEMEKEMTRILTDGLAHGHGIDKIARNLAKNVSGLEKKQALVIARTEVIRAHNEGQLDSFEEMNMEDVGVMAEWSTAADGKVCPLCDPMEGVILTAKEARGMLPRHPGCRCAWIPANVGEHDGGTTKTTWAGPEQGLEPPGTAPTGKTTGQIWDKNVAQDRIRESIKAEFPNLTGPEARAASKWAGADLTSISGKLKPGSTEWELAARETNAALVKEATKAAAKAAEDDAAATLEHSLKIKVGLVKSKYGFTDADITYAGDAKEPAMKASKMLQMVAEKDVTMTEADWAEVAKQVNEDKSVTIPYIQKQMAAFDNVLQIKVEEKVLAEAKAKTKETK